MGIITKSERVEPDLWDVAINVATLGAGNDLSDLGYKGSAIDTDTKEKAIGYGNTEQEARFNAAANLSK